MLINTVKVYYNFILVLYTKGSVFKAVIVIFIVFTAVSKWLKVLLASSVFIEVVLLNIKSLKAVE